MSVDLRMRPRFEVAISDWGKIQKQISKVLVEEDSLQGKVFDNHAILGFVDARIWSPHLNITVDEDDERTFLQCVFEPSSNVWSMFMASYAFFGFGFVLAFCWGAGQAMVGHSPFMLWVAAICLLMVTNTYTFSLFGRALSFEDAYILRAALDRALERSGEPRIAAA